ncbi:MAG: FAD-dependent oxidoreductase [Candidatus Yanofskybacteria bacterium]|nr:FAD-dependent oxidoreductase [Candidatus Yanofskybacteria bacterium]
MLRDIKADLAIIGDGVAALALAYLAAQRDIRTVMLGKNFHGTTHSATGLIAPRPDYLLADEELVRRTAFECLRWIRLFYPQILSPQRFLIPIGPELPYSVRTFRTLLSRYDEIAKIRSTGLGSHYIINQANLEKMEPNLRKSDIDGAISFGEWTVDPSILLKKLGWETSVYPDLVKKFHISDFREFKIRNGMIEEIRALDAGHKAINISNNRGPLVVVNATGPWMKDVCARLGVVMEYQLKAGVQIEVPGYFFQSGIVTFDSDGKYLVCLQKKGILQVGPTNTDFSGHPDNFIPSDRETEYLTAALRNILGDKRLSPYSFLKHGFRIKPTAIDTNRPVIWNHGNAGLHNLYSLHPGKMALALLAGDEMLDRAISDGWLSKPRVVVTNRLYLDGNRKWFNEAKLLLLKIWALFKMGLFYLKFISKTP